MWSALLVDGSVVGHPSNFLAINQLIRELSIPNTDIKIDNCSEYYLVFHAIAAVGGQGRVEAVEIGGSKADGEYHGRNLLRTGKVEKKVYTKDTFPYQTSLKPGVV